MISRSRVWLLMAGIAGGLAVTLVGFFLLSGRGAEAALSWETLRNGAYPSDLASGQVGPLTNGTYEEFEPGSASKLVVKMVDIGAFGFLDDDRATDAAVVLISSRGSDVSTSLVVVVNKDGNPAPVASTSLGGRVVVRALQIESGQIVVRMRARDISSSFRPATPEVTRRYSLEGDQLVLDLETASEASATPRARFAHNPQRITFPADATATSVEGVLDPRQIADYVVGAQTGQLMKFSLETSSSNAILSVFGIQDGARLVSRSEFATAWSGVLTATQDYAVRVITLAGGDLQYTLTVEIVGQDASPAPTAAPAVAPTQPPALAAVSPIALGGVMIARPLADLSPEAAQFLDGQAPDWAVAVIVPDQRTIYVANPDEQMPAASVMKVFIMLTLLDQVTQEGRPVDESELALLWPMITESDNDSADQLWDHIGGGDAVKAYLDRIGVSGVEPDMGTNWAESLVSAPAVALALAKLTFGNILDEENRGLALELLQSVTPAQRWGVTAGAEGEGTDGDIVALKNGWYTTDEGWRVHSAGIIAPSDGSGSAYAIVIMTSHQESKAGGIAMIEGAASRIHAALRKG